MSPNPFSPLTPNIRLAIFFADWPEKKQYFRNAQRFSSVAIPVHEAPACSLRQSWRFGEGTGRCFLFFRKISICDMVGPKATISCTKKKGPRASSWQDGARTPDHTDRYMRCVNAFGPTSFRCDVAVKCCVSTIYGFYSLCVPRI